MILQTIQFLVEGDVVIIQKVDQVVNISGQIQYPALYEFRPNETIVDLIELAGGFTYNARKDTIELIRFLEDGKNTDEQLLFFIRTD